MILILILGAGLLSKGVVVGEWPYSNCGGGDGETKKETDRDMMVKKFQEGVATMIGWLIPLVPLLVIAYMAGTWITSSSSNRSPSNFNFLSMWAS